MAQRSTLISQVTTSNAMRTPRDTPPKTYGDTEPWVPSADPLAINEASTTSLLRTVVRTRPPCYRLGAGVAFTRHDVGAGGQLG